MKATIKPLLFGLVLGVGVTYLNMSELRSSSKVVPADVQQGTPSAHVKPATDAADPFASGEEDSSHPSSSDHLPRYDDYGLILTNPNSVQQRHLCIASWYGEYSIENFGRNTGHKFGPVWNRRNPIMILEEQLEFMKEFMAETDRLEMEQFPQYSDAVKRRLLRQSATDPRDQALIDWRDYFDDGNDGKLPVVWYGKSMKTKRWLAYADDKGVYEPDEALLKRIVDSEEPKSADSADPFSPSQKKSDQSAEQDVAPTGTIISISFQHPFICASWHTSNVRQKINSFYEEACDKSYRVVDCRPLREAIRFRPKPVLEQLPPHWSQRLAEGVPKGRRDGDVRRKDWR